MIRGATLALLVLLAACGRTAATVSEPVDAGVDAEMDAGPEPITEASKLDVLFVIDNSPTANFTHAALAGTVPYFLDRLVRPRCVNGLGQIVDDPPDGAPCSVGVRDFAPLSDIHVGIVSTSLGGHGADSCSPESSVFHPHQNDAAHLLTRNAAGGVVPSYDGLGFLAWDPEQSYSPPGDSDIDAFGQKLQEMIGGVGGLGCGFESQLESLYRFLIDPDPYEAIELQNGVAVLLGTDELLLEQRRGFLRPDSAVLVVLLTDEEDCSTRDGGQYYFVHQALANNSPYHLPRAREECAVDPDDPCCASCGQQAPAGCPPSPNCNLGPLSEAEDPISLRCFDQKRRFGIEFRHPIERYLDGLSAPQVADRHGDVVENPLFAGGRSPELVILAGIVGVPWQDIAIAPTNLAAGFVPGPEIDWARILPDPESDAPPADPLMIPSREPRRGMHPVTGDPLQPPTATSATAHPINGHEHLVPTDIQYACTYRLESPVPCNTGSCACSTPAEYDTNPICQDESGNYGTTQFFGSAQPAQRPLELLRDLGPRGVVASVCTAPVFSVPQPSYGYKPAVDAMMRALRGKLAPWPDDDAQ